MKALFFTCMLACWSIHLLAQEEQTVTSKLEQVTVFLQSAQLTRTAEVRLKQGETTLVFTDLSASLDPSTVQIGQKGAFILLSVNHRQNIEDSSEPSAELKDFQELSRIVQDSIVYLNVLKDVLKERESFLKQMRPTNQKVSEYTTERYENTVTYYIDELRDIRLTLLKIDRTILALNEDIRQRRKSLDQSKEQPKKRTSEFVLKVKAESSTTANFTLTYITPNASWTPSYDLKVETVEEPIQLTYKANISQRTGEDWDKVLLTFSNADPSESGIVPELTPNYLRYGRAYANSTTIRQDGNALSLNGGRILRGRVVDSYGNPLIGANITLKGTNHGTVSDINGEYKIELINDVKTLIISYTGFTTSEHTISNASTYLTVSLQEGVSLDEVIVSGYGGKNRSQKSSLNDRFQKALPTNPPSNIERKATTVEFELDIPYSIPSDGENYTININEDEMEAIYEYRAVPKLEEAAYLSANIVDWSQYNLLSGEVNLYFENTYLGKSQLDNTIPSDTLQVSLGRDRNVQIERVAIDNSRKRTFISNKQVEQRAYRIKVRNSKAQAINLILVDQIPISQNKEIEVENSNYDGGEFNEETGRVTWRLELQADEQMEKVIAYDVKYPKGRVVWVE